MSKITVDKNCISFSLIHILNFQIFSINNSSINVSLFSGEVQNFEMGIYVLCPFSKFLTVWVFSFMETRKQQSRISSELVSWYINDSFLCSFRRFLLVHFFFFHRNHNVIIMRISPEVVSVVSVFIFRPALVKMLFIVIF